MKTTTTSTTTTTSNTTSLQEKKQIRQELQKWGKNVLYLVGFEEVAQELLGSKRWKRLTRGLSYRPSSSLLPLIKDEKEAFSEMSGPDVPSSPTSSTVDDFKTDDDNQGGHQDEPLDLSLNKSTTNLTSSFGRYTPQFPLSSPFNSKEVIASVSSEFKSSSSASSSPLMVINPTSTPVLPSQRTTTSREWKRSYTQEKLEEALNEIWNGNLGTRRAAVMYGIPRSTLRNKVYKLEKTFPLGAQRLTGRRARQLAAASKVPSISSIGHTDLLSVPSKEEPSSPNAMDASSLLQVKKEPRIICKTKAKRKGTPYQRTSSPEQKKSLMDSKDLHASELLKQMLKQTIINKKPSSVSSTNTTTSGISLSNSLFHSSIPASESMASSLPSSLKVHSSFGADASLDQRRSSQEEEDFFSGTNMFDPNARLKAALNQQSLGINNNNNNLYQSQFNQMFQSHEQQVPRMSSSEVNPVDMLSNLDPASLQTLISLYLFNMERLFLASSVAAATASSNPSEPSTNLVPHLPQTIIPFTTSFPIHDNDKLQRKLVSPQLPSKKRLRDDKKVLDEDEEATAVSASSTTKSGSKNRPKRGQYRKYDREALDKAVKAVQSGEMSVHRAGTFYGVPHSTLEYKVKQRHLLRDKKRLNSSSQSREESDASPTENASQTVIGDTNDMVNCSTEARLTESMTASEDGSIGLE